MSKRLIVSVLSVMMVLSSFSFVHAEDAKLQATDWTQKVFSVRDNTLANETLNYSAISDRWDPQNETHYRHIVSCKSTAPDNLTVAGGASNVFYIGNWSIGTIPVSDIQGKFYVAVLVRTNSASKPNYRPLLVTGGSAPDMTAANAFKADGSWEFNTIDFDYDTPPTSFTHGQFRFNTEAGKYIDIAAWGIFASTVAKTDAETALRNASKVSESDIVTTSIADRNGNMVDAHYVGKVTLPVLEDTADEVFAGWTDTKNGTKVVAKGGTEYTATESVILYPVFTAKVRFVNGSASTNGDGLTPETPYTSFASAANDLKDIGGTIVITGETTNFAKLNNTKDIVITSVFNGVDYRENGAKFNFSSVNKIVLGYVENPGKVTFENINITDTSADGWHLYGHSFEVKDSVNALTTAGSSAKVQIMAVCSNNESNPPKAITKPFSITVDNTSMSSIILGARIPITISDVDINVNGELSEIAVSNNTYNRYWSENDSKVDVGFGKLTVDGDIKITVNGKLTNVVARTAYASKTDYYHSLDKITGNIAVIVNHGGEFVNNISTPVCEATQGKWIKITGAEGTTLSYGENADDIVLMLADGLDYNFVTVANSTTEKEYTFFIEDGTSEFTLPESGIYTLSLTKKETKTVSFTDSKGGNTVEDMTAFEGGNIILPTLKNAGELKFSGWTDEENGKDVKYAGGAEFTVTSDITLYALWSEFIYPDNVRFVNGSASSNGNGRKPASPYQQISSAAADLRSSGGTIVVTGLTTNFAQLKNTGDIVLTSVYNGIDYAQTNGAKLSYSGYNNINFGYVESGNPGKVTLENITIEGPASDGWHFMGHEVEVKDTVTVNVVSNGSKHTSIQVLAYVSSNTQMLPDVVDGTNKITIDNDNCTSVIFGAREEMTTGGYDITVNGKLNTIQVSNNTYEKTDWLDTSPSFGQLTINGDVKLTVNGTLSSGITVRKHVIAADNIDYGLKSLNGNIAIIVNYGGKCSGDFADVLKERTTGKWIKITGIEGTTLSYGETADTITFKADEDCNYNFVTLTNTTTGKSYSYIAENGEGVLDIPESGVYTMECSEKTIYGVKYVTSPYDSICPKDYIVTSEETNKHTITLPTFTKQAAHSFEGWTTTENGTTAELQGGQEYTLTGLVTLYAVWKDIPTFTVTFKDDDGNVLYEATGYAGAPMTFPENNPFKYGQKLLGYAYEGTDTVITANDTIPTENKTALPVWGAIPAGETRLYVNADTGSNDNEGTSPDKALKTIAKAVEKLRTEGGYIIVTGGNNVLSTGWNNSGDITLTSLDPVSGIDYRAVISDDGLTFKSGAYITYAYTPFGFNTITGKITINNVVLLNTTNNEFLCFHGHPFEIGKGISSYQQKSSDAKITTTTLNVRALGEVDSTITNPEGIRFTINDLDSGKLRVFALGKAANTVPGIDVTVDSAFGGSLIMGNDSLGGIATVNGDIRLTVNGKMSNPVSFTGMTNPVNGNVYVIAKQGSNANVDAIKLTDGFGKYIVTYCNGMTISHGENGTYKITADKKITDSYVKITDADGDIIDYLNLCDGKAEFTPASAGSYAAEFSGIALRKITFVTGDSDITVKNGWFEEGSEVELETDLYRYGYIFKGWTDGTNNYTEGKITMPNENITLTAIWEDAPKYSITFDANGSDAVLPENIEEFEGENIVLGKPQTSSVFVGWNEDKNAKTGVLNHIASKDTTLYTITSDTEPVYVIDTHYRGDPNNYTGARNSFRRYVIDVYLENAVASSGTFKLNTDNMFLYYLGHIPQSGIEANVNTTSINTTYPGVPGLSYYRTPSIEFTWTSENPVDTTNGRIKIARIMMYFSSWGMGYDKIANSTTDYVVSAYPGYTALAGDKEAYVTTNFYKGVKDEEVKITGKVTIEGRENGTKSAYDNTKLFILDSTGDALEYIVLENADSTKRTFTYSASIAPGEYTVKVIKDGYISRFVPVTVTENCEIPEIVMFSGDTLDENAESDGKVDIDDFTRVLRGFSKDFPLSQYINAIDLNEDGNVNVSDLAIIKARMTHKIENPEFETVIDRENLKLSDWKIITNGNKVTIYAGSDKAAENAQAHIENAFCTDGIFRLPSAASHTEDYDICDITANGISINNYRIVADENDETAMYYAQYIRDYIAETSGFGLDIVSTSEDAYDYEILVGQTSRRDNPITEAEKYTVYEEDGKFYVFYGDEQSAEMASLDLCEKILGKDSAGYENGYVTVLKGASFSGEWSVLARFGVMSDSHIGARYNWANYDWLDNTFTTFEKVHAEKGLDFIVSLGDNIDDGYPNTYASDYAVYLEKLKMLDICDAENPVEGRAEGKIPHYEICGNHDPVGTGIGGQNLLRYKRNNLWYTENENGEKVAHIAFFTDYGGYPLHDYAYSGSYASYFSYGKVNDNMVKFVEDSIIAANDAGAKHIILYNHWGISQQVGSPMLPETGLDKIASVCEKYGIKLYFNGHEHDVPYTLRRYNDIYDYDVAMTAQKHAVVEITTLRAKVTIYNSTDNTVFRIDTVPLSGRGEAKQVFVK